MPVPPVRKCPRCGAPLSPLGICCRADCKTNRPTFRPRSLKPIRRCLTSGPDSKDTICPACREPVAERFKFCPFCKASLYPADATVYALVEHRHLKPQVAPKIKEHSVAPPAQSGTYSLFDEEEADDIPTGTGRK